MVPAGQARRLLAESFVPGAVLGDGHFYYYPLMSKRKPVSLKLTLTEDEAGVRLNLSDDELTVIDFENMEPPGVRVVGFNDRQPSFQRIIELLERESSNFPGGASQVLDAYITSMERQVYNKSRDLRSEARKLAILGHALKTAKIFRKSAGLAGAPAKKTFGQL